MSVQQSGVNERLAALTEAGTSVWLDQIRRNLIESGELERLVREDSLRGVTSNPSIFEKAILGSDDYDEEIQRRAEEGLSAKEIYERIAVKDVQLAADVLRPVWDETDGHDGFVSLEVSPDLALDTAGGTLARGARLLEPRRPPEPDDQDPGHRRGPGGDRGGDRRRHQHQRHAAVLGRGVRARHRGLHPRDGAPARGRASRWTSTRSRASSSPASTPRSTSGSRRRATRDLQGTAAVANARAAYARFKEIFQGDRFAKLRDAGCPVQRPLWASTGVKNPHYPDTKYVDELVAPHTVNTMPMPTLLAAAERAEISGRDRRPGSERRPAPRSRRPGSTWTTSPKKLLTRGDRRVRQVVRLAHRRRRAGARGDRHGPSRSRSRPRSPTTSSRRSPRRDATRSRTTSPSASGARTTRSGARPARRRWPTGSAGSRSASRCSRRRRTSRSGPRSVKRDGLTDCALLGMGGSSLGPEVIRRSFGPLEHGLRLHVLDSTDPGAVAELERTVDVVEDALPRLVEVGRDGRDPVALPLLLREDGRQRVAVRGDHRPGQPAPEAGRGERLPAGVLQRPGDRRPLLGDVLLRDRARRPDGREHPRPAEPVPGGGAELHELRQHGVELRAVARHRDGRARAPAARQAHVRRLRADLELRAVGRAAHRGVHRQGGQGHPAGGRRAARDARRLRRRPRLRVPARHRQRGRGDGRARSKRWRAPGTR